LVDSPNFSSTFQVRDSFPRLLHMVLTPLQHTALPTLVLQST
jgi:hypothetical protein